MSYYFVQAYDTCRSCAGQRFRDVTIHVVINMVVKLGRFALSACVVEDACIDGVGDRNFEFCLLEWRGWGVECKLWEVFFGL